MPQSLSSLGCAVQCQKNCVCSFWSLDRFQTQKWFTRRKEPCNLRRAMFSNHLSFVRKSLAIACAAVALAFELTAAPQCAYARVSTQFEALPLVRSRQNHLLVRAFINGKAAWLT